MNIDVTLRTEPFHYIEIRGLYNETEKQTLLSTMLNNSQNFKSPEETGSAFNQQTGQPLKSNKAAWMRDLNFENKDAEEGFKELCFRPNFIIRDEKLWKDSWFFNDVDTESFQSLFSYYDDGDYYNSHGDSSKITSLSWVHKQPKGFTGGDLIFTDFDMKIPFEEDLSIIFPGNVKHEVSKVSITDKNNINNDFGRFTMTTFWGVISS